MGTEENFKRLLNADMEIITDSDNEISKQKLNSRTGRGEGVERKGLEREMWRMKEERGMRRTLYLATSCGHSRKGHGRRQQEDADVPFMSVLVVTRSWQGRGGTWRTGGERYREENQGMRS